MCCFCFAPIPELHSCFRAEKHSCRLVLLWPLNAPLYVNSHLKKTKTKHWPFDASSCWMVSICSGPGFAGVSRTKPPTSCSRSFSCVSSPAPSEMGANVLPSLSPLPHNSYCGGKVRATVPKVCFVRCCQILYCHQIFIGLSTEESQLLCCPI